MALASCVAILHAVHFIEVGRLYTVVGAYVVVIWRLDYDDSTLVTWHNYFIPLSPARNDFFASQPDQIESPQVGLIHQALTFSRR